MTNQIAPMICELCGAMMNAHAEKFVEPLSAAEAEQSDPALGGLIEEIHQCPRCGRIQSRRSK